jgi:hypothetical protein
MRSNTRECNHVRLNPHISMYKSKFATNARARKDGQRRRRNDATVAVTAATHAPHVPGAMRIAVRDAGCRLQRSPNGGTPHWPQTDHMMARQLARM